MNLNVIETADITVIQPRKYRKRVQVKSAQFEPILFLLIAFLSRNPMVPGRELWINAEEVGYPCRIHRKCSCVFCRTKNHTRLLQVSVRYTAL